MTPSRLSAYFKEYESYHRTSGNRVIHEIAIPVILITLLGLLARLNTGIAFQESELFRLDGGTLLLLAASVWYFILDWKIAAPFTLFAAGSYFMGRALPIPLLWTGFALGWVLQFIGHYHYEKRSPAFFKNFEHLLIGPLWVFARVVGYSGYDR